MKKLLILLGFLTQVTSFAQEYSIDWFAVNGGSGTSTNGQYSLSGTIGEQDVIGPTTGGDYSLVGGFWSLSAVQTPTAPVILIRQSGNDAVLSWSANAPGYLLEQNSNLEMTNGWSTVISAPVRANGFNYVTNAIAPSNQFYRLRYPQ